MLPSLEQRAVLLRKEMPSLYATQLEAAEKLTKVHTYGIRVCDLRIFGLLFIFLSIGSATGGEFSLAESPVTSARQNLYTIELPVYTIKFHF